VGPKIAQRVVLELKSKAPAMMAQGAHLSTVAALGDVVIEAAEAPPVARPQVASPQAVQAGFTADALSALVNLGYGQGDAAQAVAQAAGDLPGGNTAALIRLSLKLLAPKG
jgi:Holliday junction DNA helicase RuvA